MEYKCIVYVIDNCLDDREFRNLVNTELIKSGFTSLGFDDARISDKVKNNDNDMLLKKGGIKYTAQTFLNENIGDKEIDEVLKDMEKENVSAGIIITNKEITNNIKEKAKSHNIKIWDRTKLFSSIKNNN